MPVHLDVTQAYGKTLSTAFERVPLPADARPAAGSDAHLTAHPAVDRFDVGVLEAAPGRRPVAARLGAERSTTSHRIRGTTPPAPGPAPSPYWGASATSLPVVAGTMTIGELESGHIDHALAIAIPNARKGVFAFPAQRTDGTLEAVEAIPEGTTFRLDPKLDVPSLHLPRSWR